MGDFKIFWRLSAKWGLFWLIIWIDTEYYGGLRYPSLSPAIFSERKPRLSNVRPHALFLMCSPSYFYLN